MKNVETCNILVIIMRECENGKWKKKCTPPRRGIEPRSPAWQAGILTTILPRSCSPFGTVMGNLKCTYKKNTIFSRFYLNLKGGKTTMHKIKIWSLYLIQRCQSKFYLLWLILTHFFSHKKYCILSHQTPPPTHTPPPQKKKRKKERKKQTN